MRAHISWPDKAHIPQHVCDFANVLSRRTESPVKTCSHSA